jgi:hypothetical protein
MMIYCSQHRRAHKFTVTEAEKLIYGLQADLVDTTYDLNDGSTDYQDETSYSILSKMCPVDQIKLYMDGEMYQEHIENYLENRKVAIHESELRAAGFDVAKR